MSLEEMGFMCNAISGLQAKKVLMAIIVLAEDHVDVLGENGIHECLGGNGIYE
jgi:hypothetical protein